jgi:hypothetical protein
MGALYLAVPGAGTGFPATVATGTTLKTLLQIATPSTTRITVHGWGLSFDGVTSTSTPISTALVDVDVAASVTTLTPEKWESSQAQASLCVGGASATGSNASAEGSITSARLLDAQLVHPQSGYSLWFPEKDRPVIEISRFLRIRVTAGTTVNAIPWIVYGEPV